MTPGMKIAMLAIAVLVSSAFVVAQDDKSATGAATSDQTVSTTASSPTNASADGTTAPADGAQVSPSGAVSTWPFGGPMPQHWRLDLGTQALDTWDNNVFVTHSNMEMDSVSRISAKATLSFQGQRTRFWANYIPDFGVYARYDNLNYIRHAYTQQLERDFGGHTTVRWGLSGAIAPARAGASFSEGNFGSATLGQSTLGHSLTSDSHSVDSDVEITKRVSGRTTISSSMAFHGVMFRSGSGAPVAFANRNYSGTGQFQYDYKQSARRDVGFVLTDSYFLFLHKEHQHYQAAQASYRQEVGARWAFNIAAGPSFSQNRGGLSQTDTKLGYAVDGGMTYQGKRQQIGMTVSHMLRSGMLANQLQSWSADLRFDRKFHRRWDFMTLAGYTRTDGQSATNGAEIYSGTVHLSYAFRPSLSWIANYGYNNEHGRLLPLGYVDKQQVAVGFLYQLGSERGR